MSPSTSAYCVLIFFITSKISEIFAWHITRDYCSIDCNGRKHFVCERNRCCGPVRNCINIPITPVFRRKIVDIHNTYREAIASGDAGQEYCNKGATNMQYMNYDMELEYLAACWAHTCSFYHPPCNRLDHMDIYNHVFLENNPAFVDPASSVRELFSYIKYATADTIRSFKYGRGVRFFTNLVWAKTNKVGCAKSLKLEGESLKLYTVCMYGPKGNIEGKSVYGMANNPSEIGSECPRDSDDRLIKGSDNKFPSLCGKALRINQKGCLADLTNCAFENNINY